MINNLKCSRTPVLDSFRLLVGISNSVLCDLVHCVTLSCITSLKLSFPS